MAPFSWVFLRMTWLLHTGKPTRYACTSREGLTSCIGVIVDGRTRQAQPPDGLPLSLRSALAPGLVRRADLLRERPVAVEGGVLVDRHRGLRGVAGTRLQLGGRGAVLAGKG